MKKFNKALSLLLVFVMVLSMLPGSVLALVNSEDETYASELGNPGLAASVNKNAPEMDTTGAVISSADGSVAVTESKDSAAPEMDSLESFTTYEDDEVVCVIVVLDDECLLDQGYSSDEIAENSGDVAVQYSRLSNRHDAVVAEINRIVNGMGGAATYGLGSKIRAKYTYSIVTNAVAVEIPYAALDAVRNIAGVSSAYVSPQYSLPETPYSLDAASPSMISTKDLSGAAQVWEDLQYTGLGMRIAVIDTGLDADHPSFAGEPELVATSLTAEELEELLPNLNATKAYGNLTLEDVYYSDKVPFGFNYVDVSTDITHDNDQQGDHGTHVAGIATANKIDTSDVVGVAPDAQLLVMKVFGENGGAYWEDILAALEDCFMMNVDAVNLSLGSPAGFTYDGDDHSAEVYKRVEESDMIASIAAGNNYSAAAGNYWYENTDPAIMSNQTKDPDNGVVSSPATYIGGTVVASLENSTTLMEYMTAGGEKIPYYDNAEKPFRTYMAGEQTYVVVPNYGEPEDYEGLNVTGKIALVSRGDITFTDKQTNAYKAGAIACIVYNNVEADLTGMQDTGEIPNITISGKLGQKLIQLAGDDGVGTLTVTGKSEVFPNAVAGKMSDFSSWGVTPDLRLVPDVTALGGNILSCYDDGQYGIMSGTSMAAPHIAGMSALLLQHLHAANYAVLKDEHDYHVVAEALLMSTAEPVIEDAEGNVPYSPRKQGAGAANIYNAIQSPAYLTVLGDKPSVSLGEDEEKQGVYTFSFELNNLSDAALTYDLSGIAMTDQFYEVTVNGEYYKLMGEESKKLGAGFVFEVYDNNVASLDYNKDGVVSKSDVQKFLDDVNAGTAADMTFDLVDDGVLNTADVQALLASLDNVDTVEAQEVTVPAGGTATVFVTVTLTDDDKAYMDDNYENGIYVDGFVYCTLDGETHSLSLPFMGFYGEWSDARVFDTYSWYQEGGVLPERFYSAFLTEDYGVIGGNPYASILTEFYGEDNYTMEAHPATVSPNGDGLMDNIYDIYVSTMRNAKLLRFTWTDKNGTVLEESEDIEYVRQSVWQAAYGGITPNAYRWWMDPLSTDPVFDCKDMKNGDYVTLTIEAWLDDGDENMDESYSTKIYCDTQVPEVSAVDIEYGEDASRKLTVQIKENDGLALVLLMTQAGDVLECPRPEIVDGKASFTLDISDYDTKLQLMVADYAGNSVTYDVVSTDSNPHIRKDAFYGYRMKVNYPYNGSIYRLDDYNGWHSFETPDEMLMHTAAYETGESTVLAAEYVDGYIIGVDAMNRIFTMKAGDWTRNYMRDSWTGDYCYIGIAGWGEFDTSYRALDMAYDFANDVLYVLTDESSNESMAGMGGHLLTVDIHTGECTDLGVVPVGIYEYTANYEDAAFYTAQGLTLACDNEGNLYTIGYSNGTAFEAAEIDMPAGYTAQYNGVLYKISAEALAELREGDEEILNEKYLSYLTCQYEVPVDPIGDTGFDPDYRQSMTFDHATGKLYWLANDGLHSYFYEVDTETGALTECSDVEQDSWMSSLFKPYTAYNYEGFDDAQLTGLAVANTQMALNVGSSQTLNVFPQPYYADLGELVWSSSKTDVVTVEDGVLTAKADGTAVITVTSKNNSDISINITVEVKSFDSELTLFDNSNGYWLRAEAGNLATGSVLQTAVSSGIGFASAAYFDGNVYVVDGLGGFYRADPETLEGTKIGSCDSVLTALAFNYADGYLYGISSAAEDMGGARPLLFGETTSLYRVNPNSGETELVATADPVIAVDEDGEEYYRYYYLGGLSIDYDGNFYTVYMDTESSEYLLVKSEIVEGRLGGKLTPVASYILDTELCSVMSVYTTMVYGDNGIYMSDCYGKVTWIDLEKLPAEGEMLSMVNLGTLGGFENLAMFTVPAKSEEPDIGKTSVDEVVYPETGYMLVVGATIDSNITAYPWNANPEITYSIQNTSVAKVSKDGKITGIAAGETTLIVNVENYEYGPIEIPVVVRPSTGDIYGYMVTDYNYGSQTFVKFADNAANTDFNTDLKYIADYMVYAGAYYDGLLYTYAQDFTSELTRESYLVVFNAYNYKIVNEPVRVPYTVRDMAFDYSTGNLYAIVSSAELRSAVAQIDIETGEATIVGEASWDGEVLNLVAMTIDENGQMYAIDALYNYLFTVDKMTGEAYNVGWDGIGIDVGNVYQSMHYDLDTGNIYWAAASADQVTSLRIVDVETGTSTSLGLIGPYGMQLSAMYTIPGDEAVRVPDSIKKVTDVKLREKDSAKVGSFIQLSATVLVEYEMTTASVNLTSSREDLKITWMSDDETVATVVHGKVACHAPGVAKITATVGEYSATCVITVTENDRVFFAYDGTNNQWVSFSDPADVQVVHTYGEDETPLQATLYVSAQENGDADTIYAFDRNGYFYTIDPDTFERTIVTCEDWDGNVMNVNICELLEYSVEDAPYITVVDFAYHYSEEDEMGWFYVAVVVDGTETYLVEFMPEYGLCSPVNDTTDTFRPGNLTVKDGMLIWVDDFNSGWLHRFDLMTYTMEMYGYAGIDEWGYYNGSAALWEDPLTGTVYMLRGRGMPYAEYDYVTVDEEEIEVAVWYSEGETDLWIIDLHDGSVTQVGETAIGQTEVFMGIYLREPTAP